MLKHEQEGCLFPGPWQLTTGKMLTRLFWTSSINYILFSLTDELLPCSDILNRTGQEIFCFVTFPAYICLFFVKNYSYLMKIEDYGTRLRESGLRVTPQRLAVYEAVDVLHDHPTAEEVSQYIRKKHPEIALGTIYKTLETLAEKAILRRVKTDSGLLRYDAVDDRHHHIYCTHCDRIEDYYDAGLTKMLYDYFEIHRIPGFRIEDIKLQIVGKYTDNRERIRKR